MSGAAAGLVYTSTSGNLLKSVSSSSGSSSPIRIIPWQSRLKRMKRGVITSARLAHAEVQQGGYRWKPAMITLTYRPGVEWQKRDISDFLQHCRKFAKRKQFEFRYVWVMELTKRGVPHFHVVVWMPKGLTFPKPDKQGWWPHGMTKIEWARNAVGYLAKYASKGVDDAPAFPKGARIHGFGGLGKDSRNERTWWLSPSYVREKWLAEEEPRRAKGGGWISRVTGEWIDSLYRVVFDCGSLLIMPKTA